MLTTSNLVLTLLSLILRFALHESTTNCPDVPKLDIIPGFGLDALTNKDTKQMFLVSYNQCKLTEDGNYIIPDTVDVIKLNFTEISGNVMRHWRNFASTTRFNEISDLHLSFSDDYQEMKYLQVKYRSFTCQSRLVETIYRVFLTSSPSMTPALKTKLVALIRATNKNQMKEAKYIGETIIRDYGTHFVSSVDVGKMFTKEDYLRIDFLDDRIDEDETLVTESKLSLLEAAKYSWGDKQGLNSTLIRDYNNAIIESRLRYIGSETPETVNRSVYVLSKLLIAEHFPNVSSKVLRKVRQVLDDEIQNYFEQNSHRGCTDPNASNFVYIANIDDNSCQYLTSGYNLGGFYQLCIGKNRNGCAENGLNNSITGETNCPSGFRTVLLHKESEYETYYCITNSTVDESYHFGGLYSKDVDNVQTKGKTCPPFFQPIFILNGKLAICVSPSKTEVLHTENVIPFVGFASCLTEFQCPIGFEKHLAVKLGFDNIYYCALQDEVGDFGLIPLLLRPPYINVDDNDNFIDDDDFNEDYGDYDAVNFRTKSSASTEKINSAVVFTIITFNFMYIV